VILPESNHYLQAKARFRQSRVEEIKNPSKSPFTKGDFLYPPFEKGGKEGFLEKRELEFQMSTVQMTLTFW
jgi:hypothetical protein